MTSRRSFIKKSSLVTLGALNYNFSPLVKDINGVEIYKGDIAKIENEYTDEYIDEVYFYKGTWTFGDLYLDEVSIDFDKLKVIGNKFENPELIKEKNK